MDLSMKINNSIIAISEPQDCNECAVAQALRKTFEQYYPVINVTVYHNDSEITIYDEGTNMLHRFTFENSFRMAEFIEWFDNEAMYDEDTNTTVLEDFEGLEIKFNMETYEYIDSKNEHLPLITGETVCHMTSEDEDGYIKLGKTQKNLDAHDDWVLERVTISPPEGVIKVTERSRLSSDPRELLKYAKRSYKNNAESPHQAFLLDTFNTAKESLKECGHEDQGFGKRIT